MIKPSNGSELWETDPVALTSSACHGSFCFNPVPEEQLGVLLELRA